MGVLCIPEQMNARTRALSSRGLEIFDRETDAPVLQDHVHLARLRVIPIDGFDPERYL